MNLAIHMDAARGTWDGAAAVLTDSAVKGVVLLALAAMVAWTLRNRSAAARHLNWLLALTSLLLLPALSLLVPQWRLSVLPAPMADVQPSSTSMPERAPEMASSDSPLEHVDVPEITSDIIAPSAVHDSAAASAPIHAPEPASTQPLPAVVWVLAGWIAVALVVLAQLPIGLAVIAWRRRNALPLNHEPWSSLVANMARSLALRRNVAVFISADAMMPMAAGLFRPAILLPAEARGWTPDKRRVVLLHELAHVRRRDCLTQALAHVALALHWFNPLAWFAMRRLTTEREMACDDMVLTPGSGPEGALASTYAAHLVEIARTTHAVPSGVTSAVAVPMARRSQLEGRLRAILDAARPRHPATGRMIAFALFAAAVLIVPLASVRLSQAQAVDEDSYQPIAPESQPTSDITGIVTDESGQPIPGAQVLAVEGWLPSGERRTTQTDAQGRFSFGNLKPDGYWSFSANHPRYAWQWDHAQYRLMPTGPESLPVEITLVMPATLHGSVVNADGQPVAGVDVVLFNQILPGDIAVFAGHGYTDGLVATTDDAGRFTMNRLRPGEAFFVLKHPDYALTEANAKINDEGAPVTFTIDRGMTLEGRVVHEGRPLPDIAMHAEISQYRHLQTEWDGRTDAQGRFRIERIPPLNPKFHGDAQAVGVSIAPDEEKWWSNMYAVFEIADRQLPPVTIEARPREPGERPQPGYVGVGKRVGMAQPGEGGTINVAVPGLDDDRFHVSATLLDDTPFGSPSQMLKDGKAVFENLPPGPYAISVFGGTHHTNRPGIPPKRIEVAAGQTVNITLEPGPLRIKGVVRSGGKPVERGYISWFASPKPPGSVFQGGVQVQPDGSYAIEGLTQGRCELLYQTFSLDPALRNPNRQSMLHTSAVELRDPVTTFDMNLPTGRIEGTLIGREPKPTDPERRSIGSIHVWPRGFPPKMPRATACYVEADADGRFMVDHLAPGVYTMTGYGLATTVTIEREGSVVQATLRPPEKTGQINGTVPGGIPAAYRNERYPIDATAVPEDEHGYDAQLGLYRAQVYPETGTFRIRNLPVGTYGVFIEGYQSDLPPIWVPGIEVRQGLSRELSIDIPRGRRVSLGAEQWRSIMGWRIKMPSGEWLDGSVFGDPEPRGNERVLPLGQYTAQVAYGPRDVVTQTFTIEPGEGTLRIVLMPPQ